MPLSNARRFWYARVNVAVAGDETDSRKSRCEKMVWLHSLHNRIFSGTVSLGGGFSVKEKFLLAGYCISIGGKAKKKETY